jgi:hypothetical protein
LLVFNEIDEEQSGTITARKFNRYMDRIEQKSKKQQQYVDDPESYFNERKDEVNFSTPSTTPVAATGSAKSSSRSNFYQKIARKIQAESSHKCNLSIAISTEKIPQVSVSDNSATNGDDNKLFTETESADDFLAKFRAKNGMESSATPTNQVFEEERKTTDQCYEPSHRSVERIVKESKPTDEENALSLLADLKFVVLEAVHPARGISTRQRLRELFHDDVTSTIDFSVAEKFFDDHHGNSSSSSRPDFYPYLKEGPCTWHNYNKYLRHYEETTDRSRSDFKVKIEISLPVSGYTCIITSPVLNWIQKAARKIKALPLPDMHLEDSWKIQPNI